MDDVIRRRAGHLAVDAGVQQASGVGVGMAGSALSRLLHSGYRLLLNGSKGGKPLFRLFDKSGKVVGSGTYDDVAKQADEVIKVKLPKPLGRGSSANLAKGATLPRNLRDKLAIEEVISNPWAGSQLPVPMNDTRWPSTDG